MAKSIFEVITDEIQETLKSVESSLAGGRASDYAAYREMIGRIQALRSIQSYITELSRNYMEQEDD
jgi:hypothetical protein